MAGLFRSKRVIGVDLSEDKATLIQAKETFRKLEIEKFFIVEKEGNEEKVFPNIRCKLNFDVEDIIVTNARMDLVIFITMDVPLGLKRKEYEEMAKLEAARNFGIPAGGILSALLGRAGNKAMFAIAKKETISETALRHLEDLGLGEPDVVIPDVFKYLYMVDIGSNGNIIFVVLNFVKDYFAVVLQSFTEILGIRVIFRELSEIVSFIRENEGVDIYRVENVNELNGTAMAFLKRELTDLSLEIDREISLMMDESFQSVGLYNIDAVVLVTDPNVLEGVFREVFFSVNSNLTLGNSSLKYSMNLPNIWLNIYKGALGLTLRGVEGERIEFVSLKEEKG